MHVIVSLTSHGGRINESASRAICTLLDQTIPRHQPGQKNSGDTYEVVLWLHKQYEESVVDTLFWKFSQYIDGFEIRFIQDDFGSATKLLPALAIYPGHTIVTADDDLYYPRDWLERLITEHKQHPDCIIGHRGRMIHVERGYIYEKYHLRPYKFWPIATHNINPNRLFLTGCAGMLFPPHSFSTEVFVNSLRQELCSNQDDMWWWLNAWKNETQLRIVPHGYTNLSYIDPNDMAGGTSLYSTNITENDKIVEAIFKQFPDFEEYIINT